MNESPTPYSLEAREGLKRRYTADLGDRRRTLTNANDNLLKCIVEAHEDGGLTFRQIAQALGRTGAGAVYHLYMKGKEKGF